MHTTMLHPFFSAIFSGSCSISSTSSFFGVSSNESVKSAAASTPNETFGFMRDINCLMFSIHSSAFDDVCFSTAEAKAA